MKRTHLSRTKWFDLLFRAYRRKESASTRTSGSRALSAGQGGKRIPSSDKVTTHDPAWDFLKVFSQLLEVQARPWPTWPSGNKSIVNPTVCPYLRSLVGHKLSMPHILSLDFCPLDGVQIFENLPIQSQLGINRSLLPELGLSLEL